MPEVLSLYFSQTEVIQASIISAIGTTLAALIAAFFTLLLGYIILRNDRKERAADRSIELKKELYAQAVASLSIIGTTLAEGADTQKELGTVAKTYQENSALISKLQLVCKEEIIITLSKYNDLYLEAFFAILKKRFLLSIDKTNTPEQSLDGKLEMMNIACSCNLKLIPLIADIIALLRNDLGHPFEDETLYKTTVTNAVKQNYEITMEWIDDIKKLNT